MDPMGKYPIIGTEKKLAKIYGDFLKSDLDLSLKSANCLG